MSKHPYLPLSCLDDHFQLLKYYKYLKKHPEMTIDIRKKYPILLGYPIKRGCQVYFQRKSFNFIKWEKHPYIKKIISYHSQLPLSLVINNPYMGWDFKFLYLYHKWAKYQIHFMIDIHKMNWKYFSRNPYLDTEMLYEFIDYPWDWDVLAIHPSFPPQDIYHNEMLTKKWKWELIFKNPILCPFFWKNYYYTKYNSYILLYNHFQYDGFLRLWAIFKIQRFMIHYILFIKPLRIKIKYIHFVSSRLYPELMHHVLSFI